MDDFSFPSKQIAHSGALFTWKEDPRRGNNFLFGLHAEIYVGVVTKWRMKARQNCRSLVAERPAAAMFGFLVSRTRISRPKVVYMALGSSSLHVNSPSVK